MALEQNTTRRYNAPKDALFALRVGCGLVALISGILKFTAPALFAIFLAASPLGFTFGPSLALMPYLGIVEVIVGALLIVGLWTRPVSWIFAAWALLISLATVGGTMTLANVNAPTLLATALPSMVAAYHFFAIMPAAIFLALSNAGRDRGMDERSEKLREEAKPRVTLYPEEKQKVRY